MGKKAFITGITGQDGAHLAQLLLNKNYEVHGGARRVGVNNTGRLDELEITGDIHLHDFELLEESNVRSTIENIAPDEFYNLAAQSFVGVSFNQPLYTANVDGLGVIRILETLRALGANTRYYQASTSEMFGKVQETPQNENTPFYPRSPYGIAKLFAHWSTVNYRESYGMHASNGILFNHEGPLRGREFVTRKITLALARMKADLQTHLELGNLNAKRDWGYAGDYVEGMWRMLQQDTPDDYVLATGQTNSVREFVETAARFLDWEIEWSGTGADETGIEKKSGRLLVSINRNFYRPAEVELLIGDPKKAREKLGWNTAIGFENLVEKMLRADMGRVEKGHLLF